MSIGVNSNSHKYHDGRFSNMDHRISDEVILQLC